METDLEDKENLLVGLQLRPYKRNVSKTTRTKYFGMSGHLRPVCDYKWPSVRGRNKMWVDNHESSGPVGVRLDFWIFAKTESKNIWNSNLTARVRDFFSGRLRGRW